MDKVVPFDQIGVANPGPYRNADPGAGQRGSIINANFFPAVMGEILAIQDEAGLNRDGTDFTQALQALRSGKLNTFVDTGTAEAVNVTPTTGLKALFLGTEITFRKGNAANATTTPTLTVNVGGGIGATFTKAIAKEDGSALAVGDLPAGALVTVKYDGNSLFRVVGLRKSDASISSSQLTQINNAIYALSPGGLQNLSVSAGLQQQSDIAVAPAFTTVIATGSFTGADFAIVSGACALRNDSSGYAGGTVRLALIDETANVTVGNGPYVGGSSNTAGIQMPYTAPTFVWQGLNKTKRYHLSIVAQKGSTAGTTSTWDPSITVQHNGSNV